jgi:lipoic acid synthetase
MPDKPVLRFSEAHRVKSLLRRVKLNTVCEESRCPNISECFGQGTATFMILGDRCTRSCSFCNVKRGSPKPPDPEEPYRILKAVKSLGLRYVVITSVTRDDLPDGGAQQFAACVRVLKEGLKEVKVEVLIPDFGGLRSSVERVVSEGPDVVAHNVETVPRLYGTVRGGADYRRSLRVLRTVKETDPSVITKSALILGLGERREEVLRVMEDLREAGCDVLTMGQYYQPSLRHHPVVRYYSREEFEELKEIAYSMGFKFVASGPNVRSSYRAFEQWMSCRA